jgi:hypothetical protein
LAQIVAILSTTHVVQCFLRLAIGTRRGDSENAVSSTLWRIAGPWLKFGSLQWRARKKPRGYAGDFLMLAQIGADRVCGHPLGAAFDRFLQAQAAPQAVRKRRYAVISRDRALA